ncbi:hypothetical protein ACFVSK_21025 [Cellulosimicrobium cellulans]|uniref:hypothetical protein n=1 Tax=Cellulosimicrobium cellulans TaxID=1710 RepID=UPI0036ED80F2
MSESDASSTKADVKFVICDFDPNKNDVSLNRDTIESWISSLVGQPVVGKVETSSTGVADFTSHNAKTVEKVDSTGKKYKTIEFDTSAFGTFNDVAIETIDDKEYIVANAHIWKRYDQAYEVLKARADSIKTSWEIRVSESHMETINGRAVKFIDKGEFFGHALLGSSVTPAYDSSGVVQVASANEIDFELAEALCSDIEKHEQEKEGEVLPKKVTEVSALSARDLHQKVKEALNPKGYSSNPYYSVWEVYPEEHKILAYDIDRNSNDDYMVFTYSVADNTVTIGEGTEAKLSQLLADKEPAVSLSKQVDELSEKLDQKNNDLIAASEQIVTLESSIKELEPFKAEFEAAEQERLENELAEKRNNLKEIATKSGYISEEELETSEIKELIDNADEKGIKLLIAERVVSQSETKKKDVSQQGRKMINTDDDKFDYRSILSSLIKK